VPKGERLCRLSALKEGWDYGSREWRLHVRAAASQQIRTAPTPARGRAPQRGPGRRTPGGGAHPVARTIPRAKGAIEALPACPGGSCYLLSRAPRMWSARPSAVPPLLTSRIHSARSR